MAKKLDKILVIDIEATCWNTGAPEGMTSDIKIGRASCRERV